MHKNSFYDAIYKAVMKIPRGKVASYGSVAAAAGNPRAPRVVGYALHRNPAPGIVPCHRVVMRDGSLTPAFAFGGEGVQRQLLEDEGVTFTPDGKVVPCCFVTSDVLL